MNTKPTRVVPRVLQFASLRGTVRSRFLLSPLVVSAIVLRFGPEANATSLPRSRAIPDLLPGDVVLCLYDSTEGVTEERNPLSTVVVPAIRRLGLDVRWHDIGQSGLPPLEGVAGMRAVVTGFLDGAMRQAARYPEFVRDVVAQGVRFVIIGNYGAWQEGSLVGPYVPADTVNIAFEALGVRYRARWTSDPSLFHLEEADPAVGPTQHLDADSIRHFYQFDPIRDDVRVLVAARRRDDPSGSPRSAPVFTSATGAMILQRYLSASDLLEDISAFRFDIRAFLSLALAYTPPDPSTLLVLHDPDSDLSREAMRSLKAASSYTLLPMRGVPIASASRLRPMDVASHAGVVLALNRAPIPSGRYLADLIGAYVRGGGRAVSILPVADPDLMRILAGTLAKAQFTKASGLSLRDGLFPGVSGMRAGRDSVHWTLLPMNPEPDCRVLVESESPPLPLWWRCPKGAGEVGSLLAVEFADRAFLGFVIQAVLDAVGTWAMPVLAAAVEFVDDCPLPMSGRVLPQVGRRDDVFYSDDFYSMLLEARTRFRIRPTFLAVFSYSDAVQGPFGPPFAGSTASEARTFAQRIVNDDFPVGLHGMNHMSPALSGGVSRPFPNASAIEEWAAAARDAFSEVFGPHNGPVVFVPPNNYMDEVGKRALIRALPNLRILSSVFTGSALETIQDFAMDPDVPGVVNFPRTWAGHVLTGESLVQMVNGLLALSVSSHFIHPDDVLDPERSGGRSWADLRRAFLDGTAEIRRRFPFLRERTVEEAAEELRRVLGREPRVLRRGNTGLRVERASGRTTPDVLLARLPIGCEPAVRGGRLLSSDPLSGRHHVLVESRVLDVGCDASHASARREP